MLVGLLKIGFALLSLVVSVGLDVQVVEAEDATQQRAIEMTTQMQSLEDLVDSHTLAQEFELESDKDKRDPIYGKIKHVRQQGILPVEEAYWNIISKFGVPHQNNFVGNPYYNTGVGIQTENIYGASIKSILPGEVVVSSSSKTLGKYIIVDHKGVVFLYANMVEESKLERGDMVETGDFLGFVGRSKYPARDGLYLEASVDGDLVNPLLFINERTEHNNEFEISPNMSAEN